MVHRYKLSFPSIALALIAMSLLFTGTTLAQSARMNDHAASIEYHFPMDGSRYVPTRTGIIIRPSGMVDRGTLSSDAFLVTGSTSGRHDGAIVISDDRRTLVFTPNAPFDLGEHVSVQLQSGLRTTASASIPPVTFSFDVSNSEPTPSAPESPFIEPPTTLNLNATDSLPTDLPQLTVIANNHPAPGDILLTTFDYFGADSGNYRMIIDSLAHPLYYAKPSRLLDWDFKLLSDGRFAFAEGGYVNGGPIVNTSTEYYIMDSTFVIVDSFATQTVSPYTTDFHDMEILPNGHALMIGSAPLPNWDMSKDVPRGNKNATLVGAVIEEVDNSIQQPVWIWRSWDPGHYLDTDATNDNFLEATVDAVHPNAVQQDTDGNILLSARSMDEITKINRFDTAGTMIWRLGGKHNQFTFVNDSIHFSHQHAIRRIANGHLTLFDNGNYGHFVATVYDTIYDSSVTPPQMIIDTNTNQAYARACEYDVNIGAMTATLVWHYDHDSTISSSAMGYVQRLSNGNTMINWGLYQGATGLIQHHAVTEVDSAGKITFEMDVQEPYEVYRAYKFQFSKPLSGVSSASPGNSALVLGEPFPNPSNGSSRVILSAPSGQPVQLDLYDAVGRNVRDYFTGSLEMPVNALEIETGDLPNGAYELVLRSESGTVSRQLLVLR